MLVQKRVPNSEPAPAPIPTFRIRIKFGTVYHDIYISSEASFGELKKKLSGPTGLHPLDMKILYKDKERDSKEFLDSCGVKDKSKMVVVEDLNTRAKRLLEMRRLKKLEEGVKSIEKIGIEVDKLANKVHALESIIKKGEKVAESDVLTLIELLMTELLKLDAVVAEGDAKIKRRMQVKRVQEYVERLDMIKAKNSEQAMKKMETIPLSPVVTKRMAFDLVFSPTKTSADSSASSSGNPTPRLDWELF